MLTPCTLESFLAARQCGQVEQVVHVLCMSLWHSTAEAHIKWGNRLTRKLQSRKKGGGGTAGSDPGTALTHNIADSIFYTFQNFSFPHFVLMNAGQWSSSILSYFLYHISQFYSASIRENQDFSAFPLW